MQHNVTFMTVLPPPVELKILWCKQGYWKQSPDGQAQLGVIGEDVNNLRAKCKAHGKILNLAIFSSQVALSLHFSFELRVNLMRAHLTYPAEFYFSNIQSGNETTKSRMHNYVSTLAENRLAMAGPAGPVPAPMVSE